MTAAITIPDAMLSSVEPHERVVRLSDRVARATQPARAMRQSDGSIVIEIDVYPIESTTALPVMSYRESLLARLLRRRAEARQTRSIRRRSPRH